MEGLLRKAPWFISSRNLPSFSLGLCDRFSLGFVRGPLRSFLFDSDDLYESSSGISWINKIMHLYHHIFLNISNIGYQIHLTNKNNVFI